MVFFISRLNSFIWGGGTVALLLITGSVYTIRLRAVQLSLPGFLLHGRRKHDTIKGLSQRKTVCMSLGAAMGTGNITGVAAALAAGGPGAVFWMWVSAFLGMALVYAENSLSAIYSDGRIRGPMAYISKGLGCRRLADAFSAACIFATLGMGGMVQISSIAGEVTSCMDAPAVAVACISFFAVLYVTCGGARRIGTAAELLLPAAALLYAAVCAAVIFASAEKLPAAFCSIFTEALGLRQASGGTLGYALSVGIRRGIFSNEAGLGSSPLLHSAAGDSDLYTQSMWSMFEVFLDTMICCTLTALTIICAAPDLSINTAAGTILGGGAGFFLSAVLTVFAFCTVTGWYYCGEAAFRHLFGGRHIRKFCVFFSVISASGAVLSAKTVWELSDVFNGVMMLLNLPALILLMKKVRRYKS